MDKQDQEEREHPEEGERTSTKKHKGKTSKGTKKKKEPKTTTQEEVHKGTTLEPKTKPKSKKKKKGKSVTHGEARDDSASTTLETDNENERAGEMTKTEPVTGEAKKKKMTKKKKKPATTTTTGATSPRPKSPKGKNVSKKEVRQAIKMAERMPTPLPTLVSPQLGKQSVHSELENISDHVRTIRRKRRKDVAKEAEDEQTAPKRTEKRPSITQAGYFKDSQSNVSFALDDVVTPGAGSSHQKIHDKSATSIKWGAPYEDDAESVPMVDLGNENESKSAGGESRSGKVSSRQTMVQNPATRPSKTNWTPYWTLGGVGICILLLLANLYLLLAQDTNCDCSNARRLRGTLLD